MYNKSNTLFLLDSEGTIISVDIDCTPTECITADCIRALSCVLPLKTIYILLANILQNRSYNTENITSEWQYFSKLLLNMFGKLPTEKDQIVSDWNYLNEHNYYSEGSSYLTFMQEESEWTLQDKLNTSDITDTPPGELHSVIYALHLLCECYRINILNHPHTPLLKKLVFQLCQLTQLDELSVYYTIYSRGIDDIEREIQNSPFICNMPNIHSWLLHSLEPMKSCNIALLQNPYSPFDWLRKSLKLASLLYNTDSPSYLNKSRILPFLSSPSLNNNNSSSSENQNILSTLIEEFLYLEEIECLPLGLSVPIKEKLNHSKKTSLENWDHSIYKLIGREDMAIQRSGNQKKKFNQEDLKIEDNENDNNNIQISLRFCKDLRITEVKRLLSSNQLSNIRMDNGNGMSDHDLVSMQQNKLMLIAKRTMALSIGRGMFTFGISEPLLTESTVIPPLNLNGRVLDSKTTVTLDTSTLPNDFLSWPEFHNGVAAGLKISGSTNTNSITSTWIVYNKSGELSPSHAGLLLALGMTGLLNSLSLTKVFDYLSVGHELTSIALLIGMAATKKGSMDAGIAKLLSIHVPSLHPPSSTELDVPSNIQTAALLGLGLLYQSTAHRRMTELLLMEIGREPNDHLVNNREAYSLTAGIGLGLINLGQGSNAAGLHDLKIEEQLFKYINGGNKAKNNLHNNSILVLEGKSINIDVTAPGKNILSLLL